MAGSAEIRSPVDDAPNRTYDLNRQGEIMKLSALLLVAMAVALSSGAQAQSNQELKKTVQDLQNRVKTLEQQKPGAPVTNAAGATVVAPGSTAEEGAPHPDKARVEIFGQVMLDAIYDFKRVDPDWNATLRPSKIPVNCPG